MAETTTIGKIGVGTRHYVGMTREQVSEQSWFSKILHGSDLKIFDKIDTNKNGILEDIEICAERDIQITNKKLGKAALLALGASFVATSCPVIGGALLAMGIFGVKKLDEEQRVTNAYRQETFCKIA